MKASSRYPLEHLFIASVILLSIAGFWNIYFGARSDPDFYHHLHVLTIFIWLFLLLFQLRLIATNEHGHHKKVGLSILVIGPLLVATTTLLSIHSAHKGLLSGRGDFLIVQNVTVTLELALIMFLAFAFRKRRKLHASLLLSTGILLMGIALFFTLTSFVPGFKVEGPETFYRFQTAGIAAAGICLGVGLVFFLKNFRNGWPFLLAGSFFVLNELIRSFLAEHQLIGALTQFVGSLSQALSFVVSFSVFLGLLLATGMHKSSLNRGR